MNIKTMKEPNVNNICAVIITYHPNSLIRNNKLKNLVWKDFKFIKSILNN